MATHSYEVEIKSLLGGKAAADRLKHAMQEKDSSFALLATSAQLNHYFTGQGNLSVLFDAVCPHISEEKKILFQEILSKARDYSLRTRQAGNRVILVIKASVDDTTSSNGTARLEFESEMPGVTLDALDQMILGSGFHYQAKWSREREEYAFLGATVCIDKNAGYGYLAEFELVEDDLQKVDAAKERLRSLMNDLGVVELPQDRLARMFDFYNAHWPEYYGTENIFTIE